MKYIYIIQSNRKSLTKYLYNHYKKNKDYKTSIVRIQNIKDLKKYYDTIQSDLVKYIVFSNGTDRIDKQIYGKSIDLNPKQNFIFSENAWLTWQNYIYLDPMGIGSLSEIFSFTQKNIIDYQLDNDKIADSTKDANELLNKGLVSKHKNYILVPLQVDNDSKLLIGSPLFKKVKDFVSYMVDTIPNDINILFKNHPLNKHKCLIPKKENVYDITYENYSKKNLIKNSIFVAGINTTFLIESMFFNHRTVTYGLDVFSNKNIIIEGRDKSVDDILNSKIDVEIKNKFLEVLMSRQVKKS